MFTLSSGRQIPLLDNHAHVGPSALVARTTNIASGVFGAEDAIRYMDDAGVDMACCFATANPHTDYYELNVQILEWSRQFPNRIIPYARIHPHYGPVHNAPIIRELSANGIRGLKFHSFLDGAYPINDKRLMHPLMEVAAEESLVVIFHCGESWAAAPSLVADLAMDFPDVNMIIGHMGLYGFHTEALAFASRVENLYLDATEMYPSWWIAEAVRTVGADRVLWGSDIPYNPYGEELDKLVKWSGTPEEALPAILGGNLARLLRIEDIYERIEASALEPAVQT